MQSRNTTQKKHVKSAYRCLQKFSEIYKRTLNLNTECSYSIFFVERPILQGVKMALLSAFSMSVLSTFSMNRQNSHDKRKVVSILRGKKKKAE